MAFDRGNTSVVISEDIQILINNTRVDYAWRRLVMQMMHRISVEIDIPV